jgi:hypothetical protein
MSNVTRSVPLISPHVNLGATPASAGANELVSATPKAKYRVLSVALIATTAVSVKFQSASTDITGTFPLGANGGLVLPFNEHGWFETNENQALNLNLGSAVATGVQIQYIKLPVGN